VKGRPGGSSSQIVGVACLLGVVELYSASVGDEKVMCVSVLLACV
jgi:hypothetical protein